MLLEAFVKLKWIVILYFLKIADEAQLFNLYIVPNNYEDLIVY